MMALLLFASIAIGAMMLDFSPDELLDDLVSGSDQDSEEDVDAPDSGQSGNLLDDVADQMAEDEDDDLPGGELVPEPRISVNVNDDNSHLTVEDLRTDYEMVMAGDNIEEMGLLHLKYKHLVTSEEPDQEAMTMLGNTTERAQEVSGYPDGNVVFSMNYDEDGDAIIYFGGVNFSN